MLTLRTIHVNQTSLRTNLDVLNESGSPPGLSNSFLENSNTLSVMRVNLGISPVISSQSSQDFTPTTSLMRVNLGVVDDPIESFIPTTPLRINLGVVEDQIVEIDSSIPQIRCNGTLLRANLDVSSNVTLDPFYSSVIFQQDGMNINSFVGPPVAFVSGSLSPDWQTNSIINAAGATSIISYGNSPTLRISGDFTIELILRSSGWYQSTATQNTFIYKGAWPNVEYCFISYNGDIYFQYRATSGGTTISFIWNFPFLNNVVYYLFLRRKNSVLELFVNNVSQGTRTMSSNPFAGTGDFGLFGEGIGGSLGAFNIGGCRITSVARPNPTANPNKILQWI